MACRLGIVRVMISMLVLGCSMHLWAQGLTGAGSTFIYPVMSQWVIEYKKETGKEVNYQAIGSGGGLKQLESGTVAFAASDKPLSEADLKKYGYFQFPILSGGIVLAYHLPIEQGLNLDGETVADIFSGKISSWDDPQISKLNPGVKLPKLPIITVHRADGSGTTYNFTYYLSQVSSSWREHKGYAEVVPWAAISVGGKGNAGVANTIQQINGSIGYVEFSYIKAADLQAAHMLNRSRHLVEPDFASFQSSSKHADWSEDGDYTQAPVNSAGIDSWPITATTFILVRKNNTPEESREIEQFFDWLFNSHYVKSKAQSLDYVVMPKKLTDKIENTIDQEHL